MTIYSDESQMPVGKYKGEKLANVPAAHLMWYWEQKWFDKTIPLGVYIERNLDVIKQQIRNDKQMYR